MMEGTGAAAHFCIHGGLFGKEREMKRKEPVKASESCSREANVHFTLNELLAAIRRENIHDPVDFRPPIGNEML